MDIKECNGGDKPCAHFSVAVVTPTCLAFDAPVSTVEKCGGKLIKLALKKRKLNEKLKGKK
jgi:hypothetical protein